MTPSLTSPTLRMLGMREQQVKLGRIGFDITFLYEHYPLPNIKHREATKHMGHTRAFMPKQENGYALTNTQ